MFPAEFATPERATDLAGLLASAMIKATLVMVIGTACALLA